MSKFGLVGTSLRTFFCLPDKKTKFQAFWEADKDTQLKAVTPTNYWKVKPAKPQAFEQS